MWERPSLVGDLYNGLHSFFGAGIDNFLGTSKNQNFMLMCAKSATNRLFAYFAQIFTHFAVKSFLTAKNAKDTQGTQKNFCIIRGSQ